MKTSKQHKYKIFDEHRFSEQNHLIGTIDKCNHKIGIHRFATTANDRDTVFKTVGPKTIIRTLETINQIIIILPIQTHI